MERLVPINTWWETEPCATLRWRHFATNSNLVPFSSCLCKNKWVPQRRAAVQLRIQSNYVPYSRPQPKFGSRRSLQNILNGRGVVSFFRILPILLQLVSALNLPLRFSEKLASLGKANANTGTNWKRLKANTLFFNRKTPTNLRGRNRPQRMKTQMENIRALTAAVSCNLP